MVFNLLHAVGRVTFTGVLDVVAVNNARFSVAYSALVTKGVQYVHICLTGCALGLVDWLELILGVKWSACVSLHFC